MDRVESITDPIDRLVARIERDLRKARNSYGFHMAEAERLGAFNIDSLANTVNGHRRGAESQRGQVKRLAAELGALNDLVHKARHATRVADLAIDMLAPDADVNAALSEAAWTGGLDG